MQNGGIQTQKKPKRFGFFGEAGDPHLVGHVLLGQPDGFVLQPDFDFHPPVFGRIDQKLALGWLMGFFGVVQASTYLENSPPTGGARPPGEPNHAMRMSS